MRAAVLAAAEQAGRDPASVTCALNFGVRVQPRADPDPDALRGPADAVTERILGFVSQGFTAFNFLLADDDRDEQAERLAVDVIPAVRAA
jgi:hypothetical protein